LFILLREHEEGAKKRERARSISELKEAQEEEEEAGVGARERNSLEWV
jgi:hypothetical protein